MERDGPRVWRLVVDLAANHGNAVLCRLIDEIEIKRFRVTLASGMVGCDYPIDIGKAIITLFEPRKIDPVVRRIVAHGDHKCVEFANSFGKVRAVQQVGKTLRLLKSWFL